MPNAVGAVRISGQKGIHSAKMGIYEPQQLEGNTIPWTVNDRVVYRMNGRNRYLFYGASEEWCVGKRENAEKGVAAGWLVVDSQASKPEDITEEWMAFDEAAKRWDQAAAIQVTTKSELEPPIEVAAPRTKSEFKRQLVALYEEHNPAKLDGVDSLLQKYEGHEEKLVRAVRVKYGEEVDPDYYHNQLVALYQQHNPAKLVDIDRLLVKYAGHEREYLDAVQRKYLKQDNSDYREQLIDLYSKCNPDKIDQVDYLLHKYEGHEAHLLQSVKEKYQNIEEDAIESELIV